MTTWDWRKSKDWEIDPWDYSGIAIGIPGKPIKHRKFGFDVLPPRRTPLRLHMRDWLGSPAIQNRIPDQPETWVQLYPERDWECILPGTPEGRMASTRRLTSGDEVVWQDWRRL